MPLVIENSKSKQNVKFPNLIEHSSFEGLLKTLNPRQIITKESPTGAGTTITTYSLEEEKYPSIEEYKVPLVSTSDEEDSPKYYLEKSVYKNEFSELPDPQLLCKELNDFNFPLGPTSSTTPPQTIHFDN